MICEFGSSTTPERVFINWSNVYCTNIPKPIVKITGNSLYKNIVPIKVYKKDSSNEKIDMY